jgi:hypothetical protein
VRFLHESFSPLDFLAGGCDKLLFLLLIGAEIAFYLPGFVVDRFVTLEALLDGGRLGFIERPVTRTAFFFGDPRLRIGFFQVGFETLDLFGGKDADVFQYPRNPLHQLRQTAR